MESISLLIKPASGLCNMRCKYCFYIDEMNNREIESFGIMSVETLEAVIKNVFEQVTGFVTIAFQGGEPTLAGFEFFRQVPLLIEQYNVNKISVQLAIQTNGYAMDERWAKYFKENHYLVGISLDGYEELHNKYRVDAKGEGTYDKVMRSIDLFKKYEVDFNILTVVHGEIADNIAKIYNFYKRNDFAFQQYIECLEPLGEAQGGKEYSLTPEKLRYFLITLFRKWYTDLKNGNHVYNRYFENLLMILTRQQPESCNMMGICGKQWVLEADASVYPCDFYVLDEWKLGNFVTHSLEELDQKREELAFIQQSHCVPEECKKCKWYPICRNGCRRNCEPVSTCSREKNYFCKAYKDFFENVYMDLEEIVSRIQK